MVRKTSLDTFHKIEAEGLLSQRRWQVYKTLYKIGPATGTQLALIVKGEFGGWGQSETIRNRLTELRDLGVVQEVTEAPCPETGNTVIWWATNDNMPVKIKKSRLLTLQERQRKLEKKLSKIKKQIEKETLHYQTQSYSAPLAASAQMSLIP